MAQRRWRHLLFSVPPCFDPRITVAYGPPTWVEAASARDAVPSVQVDPEFKVIPVRALVNSGTRHFAH